jgi:hypothetical protein
MKNQITERALLAHGHTCWGLLCGSIAYEVDASAEPILHCSCRTCRKTHGSAFSSIASVPREKFRWTRGIKEVEGF